MCEAALSALESRTCLVLGVTVLTSLNDLALSENFGFSGIGAGRKCCGLGRTCQERRNYRFGCQPARSLGFAGPLWFSLHDRHPGGNSPHLVGPGRPEAQFDSAGRQSMTGQTILVIGRPISASTEPERPAVQRIIAELEN